MPRVRRITHPCLLLSALVAPLCVTGVASAEEPPARPAGAEQPPPPADWDDRFPFMVHVPLALSQGFPFGSLDPHAAEGFAANAGNFTSFDIGVGVRVRKFVADLMFGVGGASNQGAIADAITAAGFSPGSTLRIFFGGDFAYYPVRTATWAPWVGLRIGYEALDFHGTSGSQDSFDVNYGSFYYAARAGIDWRMFPAFGIGLYAELGLATALSAWTTVSHNADPNNPNDYSTSNSNPYDMGGTATHGLASIGVRTVFFP